MSEIKVVVYDTCGKREEVVSSLERAGIGLVSGEGEEALLAADFLVLSAADARELDERNVSEKWNFFLDELRWKRKESGEIIIIDCSDVSFSPSRLAYGLKKCKRFRLKQADEAARYMAGGSRENSIAGGLSPTPAYKTPSPSYEEKEEKPRESGACKESHVFGEEAEREKPQSQIKAEEKAAAKARQDELRKTLEERTTPVVKSEKAMEIIEEARRRLEEKRKEGESDPKLNPVFERREDEREEKERELAEIKSKRGENFNPFEGYPDYPKEKKPKSANPYKSIGITIIIAAIVLILFMVITTTIGTCSIEFGAFCVSSEAITRHAAAATPPFSQPPFIPLS